MEALTIKKAEGAAGTASASAVRDDVHITARHEEVGGTRDQRLRGLAS
jgi:hypothetical protein